MKKEKQLRFSSLTANRAVIPEDLIQALPAPIALFDANGQLQQYSPACLSLFNTSNDMDCRNSLQNFFNYSLGKNKDTVALHFISQPDADFNAVGDSGAHLVSFFPGDPSTKLLSKSRFIEKINSVLGSGEFVNASLLCISFDNFSHYKAEFGEKAGDRLLAKIAKRIRATIPDSCWIARTGDASFAVFFLNPKNITDSNNIQVIAGNTKEMLGRPFLINSEVAELNVNVGWSSTQKSINLLELFRRSELALAINTETAGPVDRPYSPDMDEKRKQERKLEFDLRKAIILNQFELHYQMQLDYTRRKISGFEALIRWRHPERGLVFPDVFIPLAERSGLIVAMGEWVIETACKEAMKWPEDIRVAVNVSPVQLQNKNLIRVIKNALEETRLSPRRLEIEITESTAIQDEAESRNCLLALKELGLTIALDDFGTGYASLSYLRSFPFDKLKIDQSFIRCEENKHQNDLVLQSMFALGRCFGMTVLAEGIETEEHQEKLLNLGCESAQGYLYSRPVPFMQTFELLVNFKHIKEIPAPDAELSRAVPARAVCTDTGIFQIAYISDNATTVNIKQLNEIMTSIQEDSKRNNTADNISGALMFNQHCFAQILEGESHVIEKTFERIQTDPRHQNIQVLDYGPIESRSFPEWAMAFIAESNSNTEHFDQLAMLTGSSANDGRTANLQSILLEIIEKSGTSKKAA